MFEKFADERIDRWISRKGTEDVPAINPGVVKQISYYSSVLLLRVLTRGLRETPFVSPTKFHP